MLEDNRFERPPKTKFVGLSGGAARTKIRPDLVHVEGLKEQGYGKEAFAISTPAGAGFTRH